MLLQNALLNGIAARGLHRKPGPQPGKALQILIGRLHGASLLSSALRSSLRARWIRVRTVLSFSFKMDAVSVTEKPCTANSSSGSR
jgi:hypothetical protein